MGYIEIDRHKIYIESYGDSNAKSLLYLHGGPGASCLDFVEQAEMLGNNYHVISFDQYGVLRSDAVSEDEFGMHDHLNLIEKMREKLGISKWSILGHSYGGTLACLYTHKFPDSVDKVIYECPSWNISYSIIKVGKTFLPYFIDINDMKGIQLCEKACMTEYIDGEKDAFEDMLKILERIKDQKLRNYLHSISYEEYSRFFSNAAITGDMWSKGSKHFDLIFKEGCLTRNWLELLKTNTQASLLICGKYDPICEEKQQNFYMDNVKNGKLVLFENSGHFPRIEEASKYTETINDFLE
jgi:proline iminopeptidase